MEGIEIFKILLILIIDLRVQSNFVICQELYGDIYPSTRAELNLYFETQHQEKRCYEDVPVSFFQTKENQPLSGNSSIPGHLSLEICCKGYRRDPKAPATTPPKCIPDCSKVSADNCRNGFCRSPQQCECFEGFVKNRLGKCVHICPVGCENGRCLLNGECLCNPGHSLDPETRKYCLPECSHIPCGLNQFCATPGECRCRQGYQWLEGLGCQPICQPHCGYGRCVAPQKCECFPGYIKRRGREICESECYANCANGFCESPYKCQCHVGFTYDPQSQNCLPLCPDACEHGVCLAPGICRCFEGYYLWDNTCKPICENGCGLYGHCVAPNICACGAGHQHCLDGGSCTARGHCLCPQGMNHFIDRCIYSATMVNLIFSMAERRHFDRELKNKFEAIIGRMFQF